MINVLSLLLRCIPSSRTFLSVTKEAHVGVGIAGNEGLQAARAADYQVRLLHFVPSSQLKTINANMNSVVLLRDADRRLRQIPRFACLHRLLLVHGRYSYKRTAFISQYFFYKSAFLCTFQIAFAFYSFFSGHAFFDTYSLTLYAFAQDHPRFPPSADAS
jgi:magnesium-transporting ATPase (P-type)